MKKFETATFGGGCFWCTEAIFKRLKGVKSVVSGYSGGALDNPTYESVSSGITGHAEAVSIRFDPDVICYKKLLDVFWATHDPTTLNRQGNDIGTQYRSVIFYYNARQKAEAVESKQLLEKMKLYTNEVVTEIRPFENFYSAEDYHQNFYDNNKSYPYCSLVINPKIKKLLEKFGNDVKDNYKK